MDQQQTKFAHVYEYITKRIRPRSQNDLVRKTTHGRLLKSTSLAHFEKANQTKHKQPHKNK